MDQDLKTMVLAFRVTELQTLLGYAGKNKTGRKNELQARALELVRNKSSTFASKVKDLYRSMQASLQQPLPASASIGMSGSHNVGGYGNNVQGATRPYGTYGYHDSAEKGLQGRNNYFGSIGPMPGNKMPGLRALELPICPDVKMRALPFYDIVAELHKPSSLISQPGPGSRLQEANFPFCLTPSQAADIAASKETVGAQYGEQRIQYMTQVQLRFCLMDTSGPQDDLFPPSLIVKINGKIVQLPHPIPSNRPGVEAKRPSKPLNVTNYVRISPTSTNNVTVTWSPDTTGKTYVISLYLVKKLCSQDLLIRLKNKGIRPAEYTKGMIKDMVRKNDDDCIATTSFKVSVACPLGKCMMGLPCRSSACKHLQCFDGRLFIQMNEKKPLWNCPVCDKLLEFSDISIDGYFDEVIKKLINMPHDGMDIEVQADGTWAPMVKKEGAEPPAKRQKCTAKADDTINLDDDDIICDDEITDVGEESLTSADKPKKPKDPEIVDLTLSSDEEDEDESPPPSSKAPSAAPPPTKTSNSVPQKVVAQPSSSSDDEQPIRRPLPRAKKPESFYVDESSSSSTSSDETLPITNGKSNPPPKSNSPDLITISPSPSPEPRPPLQPSSRAGASSNLSQSSASNYPSTMFSNSTLASSTSNNPNSVFGSGHRFRSSNSTVNGTDLPNGFQPPYMGQMDRSPWDPPNVNPFLPTNNDFSSLEFPSMDYFNQNSSSSNYNPRAGNHTNNLNHNNNGFTNWR